MRAKGRGKGVDQMARGAQSRNPRSASRCSGPTQSNVLDPSRNARFMIHDEAAQEGEQSGQVTALIYV